MSEQPVTMQDVRRLLFGLEPIARKNLLSFTKDLSVEKTYDFIVNFKRNKGIDTEKGMQIYLEKRKGGCKGCKK